MHPRSSRAALLGLACALALPSACATSSGTRPAPPPPPAQDSPAVVLGRFVDAVEGGRWSQAGGLLSARWRGSYTPPRLQADYAGAGPLAREAVARAQSALRAGTPFRVEDGRASLPVAGGRALLVAEEGGWRVDALE